MPRSAWHPSIRAAFDGARLPHKRAFPSPEDWRDQWIYFLLLDRFNNPNAPPKVQPWDAAQNVYQGGTFEGVRAQLDYLRDLGVGAIWLSPVQKNCQYDPHAYHGYGIQDFTEIEPRFASDPEAAKRDPTIAERELRHLIDDAHDMGIYVIFDIVLNHAGNVFSYRNGNQNSAELPWRDGNPYPINWHDGAGRPRNDWDQAPRDPDRDSAIWPDELRHNDYFRRRGNAFTRPGELGELAGDFYSLKEFVTEFRMPSPAYGLYYPVRDTLIRAYQYLMAKYDIDGYRIDTLKYIEPEFSLVFGNAMREFAMTLGKKNFFTFGEVYDDEEKIARFIGRNGQSDDMIGVDAALDFPLFFKLPSVAKGYMAPTELAAMFERRKKVQRTQISSHGEASQFFVTFLDNHDMGNRFRPQDNGNPARADAQMVLGLSCLYTLQGIPCLYYGTEQGLSGAGNGGPEVVREALWGKPNAFDHHHLGYETVQRLSELRMSHAVLRYGRQYFRPSSGDGASFGLGPWPQGIVAYSRILSDQEMIVIANTNTEQTWSGEVLVDYALNPPDKRFRCVYRTIDPDRINLPELDIREHERDSVQVYHLDGGVTPGPVRSIPVQLQPLEVQIWSNHPPLTDLSWVNRGRGQR